MIVHDADDVVRAEELPVWPLDHKDLGCLVAGWKFSDRVGDAATEDAAVQVLLRAVRSHFAGHDAAHYPVSLAAVPGDRLRLRERRLPRGARQRRRAGLGRTCASGSR